MVQFFVSGYFGLVSNIPKALFTIMMANTKSESSFCSNIFLLSKYTAVNFTNWCQTVP